MKKLLETMRKLDEAPRHKSKKTLYHIGPKPAEPKEKMRFTMDWNPKKLDRKTGEEGEFEPIAGTDNWSRHWLPEPVKAGVFLTSNPINIAINHGVYGNVYAYRVPQWVIAAASGLHRYDQGTEIVISKEIWEQAGDEIEFLGKSMSEQELTDRANKGLTDSHWEKRSIRTPGQQDPESIKWEMIRQDEIVWKGLHHTRYPEEAIRIMTPETRERALRSFDRFIDRHNPFGQKEIFPKPTQHIIDLLKGNIS